MVLILIGIAVGVLIAVVLFIKVIKTPSYEALMMQSSCKKCGYKTNGLKCPRCDNNASFSKKFR